MFSMESFDLLLLNVVYLHTKNSNVDMLDLILDVDVLMYLNVLYVFQVDVVIVQVHSKKYIQFDKRFFVLNYDKIFSFLLRFY